MARFAIPSGAFVHCFLARPAANPPRRDEPPNEQSWVTQAAVAASFVVLVAGGNAYLDHPEYFDQYALLSLVGLSVLWVVTAVGWGVAWAQQKLRVGAADPDAAGAPDPPPAEPRVE